MTRLLAPKFSTHRLRNEYDRSSLLVEVKDYRVKRKTKPCTVHGWRREVERLEAGDCGGMMRQQSDGVGHLHSWRGNCQDFDTLAPSWEATTKLRYLPI